LFLMVMGDSQGLSSCTTNPSGMTVASFGSDEPYAKSTVCAAVCAGTWGNACWNMAQGSNSDACKFCSLSSLTVDGVTITNLVFGHVFGSTANCGKAYAVYNSADNRYAVVLGVDLGTMAESAEMSDNPGYQQFRGSTPSGSRVSFCYKGPISLTGSSSPVTSPITPSPRPVTPSPRPVTPSPRPVTPSPRPVTPSPRPVTPSPKPVPVSSGGCKCTGTNVAQNPGINWDAYCGQKQAGQNFCQLGVAGCGYVCFREEGDSSDGGLSSGAIAGIVVGCVCGVALLVGGVVLAFRYKSQQAESV